MFTDDVVKVCTGLGPEATEDQLESSVKYHKMLQGEFQEDQIGRIRAEMEQLAEKLQVRVSRMAISR